MSPTTSASNLASGAAAYLARTYGVGGGKPASPAASAFSGVIAKVAPAAPVAPTEQTRAIEAATAARAQPSGKLDHLVAAVVPGKVDFSGDTARPTGPVLPFYSRPTDRNETATVLSLGKRLDISG